MNDLVNLLPPHTCYVEVFFHGHWKIFEKSPSPVEVINDYEGPDVLNMQRQLTYTPTRLFAALSQSSTKAPLDASLARACRCYQGLMEQWEALHTEASPVWKLPASEEDMLERYRAPYLRMLTVIWESLPWRECIERYDDERAVQVIEPPWSPGEWDQFAALALRLRRACCRWLALLPSHPDLIRLFRPHTKWCVAVGEDHFLLANFFPTLKTDGT